MDKEKDVPMLMNAKDTAGYLGISFDTFKKLYKRGDFPQPVSLSSRHKYWRKPSVDEWLGKGNNADPIFT